MGTSPAAASRPNPRTAAKRSPSTIPTETTTCRPRHASKPTLRRTQLGRCRVRSAMSQDLAAILTQQAVLLRLAWIMAHRKRRIAVNAAPAMAASRTRRHPTVNRRMFHIDLGRVQAPWVSLGKLYPFFVSSCTAAILIHHSSMTSVLHGLTWRHISLPTVYLLPFVLFLFISPVGAGLAISSSVSFPFIPTDRLG